MATTYDKILIRTSLTDDGTLPREGDLSSSPDVIPYGMEEVADPVPYFIENYDENVNTFLTAGKKNYIFIRGKSLVTGVEKADMYVYYALDADLDTPAKWSKNMLKTATGKTAQPVLGQVADTILVAPEAYEWYPPEPKTGELYSLIGLVVPRGTKPNFTGVTDFEAFVSENNNVGWTKVTIKKPAPPPIPGLRWQTTVPFKQGDVERDMNFAIYCHEIPPGTYIGFEAENKVGPVPPIYLDKTKVVDANGHTGIDSTVPAGYSSNITFSFYSNDAPPAGSSLAFKGSYVEGRNRIIVVTATTTN
jgi:hypothetical protein